MTIELPLTQGKVALIDDCDVEQAEYKWCALKNGHTFYVVRCEWLIKNKQKTISLHREILKPGPGLQVDHVDGNGLNNRRSNLRIATGGENSRNQRLAKNNISGYKGVRWEANKWRARIMLNDKLKHLGYFTDPIEAAKAYDKAAVELFGEFARLNFPIS